MINGRMSDSQVPERWKRRAPKSVATRSANCKPRRRVGRLMRPRHATAAAATAPAADAAPTNPAAIAVALSSHDHIQLVLGTKGVTVATRKASTARAAIADVVSRSGRFPWPCTMKIFAEASGSAPSPSRGWTVRVRALIWRSGDARHAGERAQPPLLRSAGAPSPAVDTTRHRAGRRRSPCPTSRWRWRLCSSTGRLALAGRRGVERHTSLPGITASARHRWQSTPPLTTEAPAGERLHRPVRAFGASSRAHRQPGPR